MLKLKSTKMLAMLMVLLLSIMSVAAGALAENTGLDDTQALDIIILDEDQTTEEAAVEEVKDVVVETVTTDVAPVAPKTPVYTVKFVNYDGEEFYTVEAEEGSKVDMPIFTPILDGHTFLFWQDVNAELEAGVEGPVEFLFPVDVITQDTTLMAVYQANPVVEEEPAAKEEPEILDLDSAVVDESIEGNKIIGKRDETLDGLSILIIEDIEEEEEIILEELEEDDLPLAGPDFLMAPVLNSYAVNVYSDHGDCMQEGDIISLWGELVGFDGMDVALQWQYSADGATWVNVPGAEGINHSFAATIETVNYAWRLAATVVGE